MLQSVVRQGGCKTSPVHKPMGRFERLDVGSTLPVVDESSAAMKRRISELLLIVEFSGVLGGILDPHELCKAAGEWLTAKVGWDLQSVCCHGYSTEYTLPAREGRRSWLSKKCQNGEGTLLYVKPEASGAGDPDDIWTIRFPDGSGSISFSRSSVSGSQYSDEFLRLIAENFAQALSNARECARLRDLSMRDHLTGLYNRRVFEAMVEVETRKRTTKPFSLLMIDLDNFKQINDTYGHGAGDQVLVAVAKMLRLSFRKSDVVSRYGGEEFAVLLPETPPDSAWMVAERFRENISSHSIGVRAERIMPTVSIGVATVTYRCGIEVTDVIEEADRVLYQAKVSGKNRVCASLLEGESSTVKRQNSSISG